MDGMSRRPTLTQAQLDALRADYEAWNPYDTTGPSASDIAAKHGVSKNTMYTWRARGWRLDGREGDGQSGWKPRGQHVTPEDHSALVQYLTEELVKARIKISELEREHSSP